MINTLSCSGKACNAAEEWRGGGAWCLMLFKSSQGKKVYDSVSVTDKEFSATIIDRGRQRLRVCVSLQFSRRRILRGLICCVEKMLEGRRWENSKGKDAMRKSIFGLHKIPHFLSVFSMSAQYLGILCSFVRSFWACRIPLWKMWWDCGWTECPASGRTLLFSPRFWLCLPCVLCSFARWCWAIRIHSWETWWDSPASDSMWVMLSENIGLDWE